MYLHPITHAIAAILPDLEANTAILPDLEPNAALSNREPDEGNTATDPAANTAADDPEPYGFAVL
jgi:hypothetical protein